ncbi:uncharacterized protein [Prorops nasuta]|uniref:uncharacterized protein n=1 Tax=Prorops nasuta TaxID=863751 RepID=UPI0034CE6FF1
MEKINERLLDILNSTPTRDLSFKSKKEASLELVMMLEVAGECFIKGDYETSSNYYKAVLNLLLTGKENPNLPCDQNIIKYMLCVSLSESDDLSDLTEALRRLLMLEKAIVDTFPTIYYALGKVHLKLYRFDYASKVIRDGISVLSGNIEFQPVNIPGTSTVIKETTKEGLMDSLLILKKKCEKWNQPDGLCNLTECRNYSEFYVPMKHIYFSDPAFTRMIVTNCNNQYASCCQKYHDTCWSYIMNKVSVKSDEEMIGQPCLGNHSSDTFPSVIRQIKIYGSKGVLVKSIENPIFYASPSRGDGTIPKNYLQVEKLRRPHTSPLDQRQTKNDQDFNERDVKDNKLPKPRKTVFSNQYLKEKVDSPPKSDTDNSSYNSTLAQAKTFLFEVLYEYINNNDVVSIDDVTKKFHETKKIIESDIQINLHFLDLDDFLQETSDIKVTGSYIHIEKNASKVFNLKDNTESKMSNFHSGYGATTLENGTFDEDFLKIVNDELMSTNNLPNTNATPEKITNPVESINSVEDKTAAISYTYSLNSFQNADPNYKKHINSWDNNKISSPIKESEFDYNFLSYKKTTDDSHIPCTGEKFGNESNKTDLIDTESLKNEILGLQQQIQQLRQNNDDLQIRYNLLLKEKETTEKTYEMQIEYAVLELNQSKAVAKKLVAQLMEEKKAKIIPDKDSVDKSEKTKGIYEEQKQWMKRIFYYQFIGNNAYLDGCIRECNNTLNVINEVTMAFQKYLGFTPITNDRLDWQSTLEYIMKVKNEQVEKYNKISTSFEEADALNIPDETILQLEILPTYPTRTTGQIVSEALQKYSSYFLNVFPGKSNPSVPSTMLRPHYTPLMQATPLHYLYNYQNNVAMTLTPSVITCPPQLKVFKGEKSKIVEIKGEPEKAKNKNLNLNNNTEKKIAESEDKKNYEEATEEKVEQEITASLKDKHTTVEIQENTAKTEDDKASDNYSFEKELMTAVHEKYSELTDSQISDTFATVRQELKANLVELPRDTILQAFDNVITKNNESQRTTPLTTETFIEPVIESSSRSASPFVPVLSKSTRKRQAQAQKMKDASENSIQFKPLMQPLQRNSTINRDTIMPVRKNPLPEVTKPAWLPIKPITELWEKKELEIECIICMERLNPKKYQPYTLTCQHTFHKFCIQDWFKRNQSCPNCRFHSTIDDEYPPLMS